MDNTIEAALEELRSASDKVVLRKRMVTTLNDGSKRKNNKSGCTGVSYVKKKNKWRAFIYDTFTRKNKHLGYFHDKFTAMEAYKFAYIKKTEEGKELWLI